MITLIVINELTGKREIYENMTLKEFGNKLVELSAQYVLVVDRVYNLLDSVGCDFHVTAVEKRN